MRVFTRVTTARRGRTYTRTDTRATRRQRTQKRESPRLCARLCAACRYECAGCIAASERCTCTRAGACETRENTIKPAPGKNTNLNGTKEICSHIRCIRMNGARLLQFTIYCFATFFSADASGIRSLLLSRSRVTEYEREETKREGGREEERARGGRAGLSGR